MTKGSKILDRLRQEQHLDDQQYQQILHHARLVGERLEDAIVSTGAISEEVLLKYMAGIYQTQFVSTRKLSRATVSADLLKLLPRKVAGKFLVFPVLYNRHRHLLSVVCGDMEAHDTAKQVQVVTGVREVNVYIAMPSAVRACIKKHYDGDPRAFHAAGRLSAPPAPAPEPHSGGFGDLPDFHGHGTPARPLTRGAAGGAIPAPTFTIAAPELAESLRGDGDAAAKRGKEGDVTWQSYLETVNVLVAVLEQDRADLRGHSSRVGRGAVKLCEKLGIPEDETRGVRLGAYLHDVGKGGSYHLTALNVAQYEGHRVKAEKTFLAPLRVLEGIALPPATVSSVKHMYERFDGSGFPDRLRGKDIPRGARILAIVETYLDLTSHAKNPFRRELSPKEACDAMGEHANEVFDGNLLDLFRHVVLGDDLKARLTGRQIVLLVDPDPEETTVLEMRLRESGMEVVIARNGKDARERFLEGDVDIVIAEVDLPQSDGFALVQALKQHGDPPIIFLTRRGDRESVGRGFELGAADYLVKPASADVVTAKTRQLLERGRRRSGGGRGVTGSLTEMSLPDVIQILSNGRKSGKLTIRADGKSGEVYFGDGAIYDARFGSLQGDEAFYAMLMLTEGDFELDPGARPTRRVINAPTESLLLEGLRRLDESQA